MTQFASVVWYSFPLLVIRYFTTCGYDDAFHETLIESHAALALTSRNSSGLKSEKQSWVESDQDQAILRQYSCSSLNYVTLAGAALCWPYIPRWWQFWSWTFVQRAFLWQRNKNWLSRVGRDLLTANYDAASFFTPPPQFLPDMSKLWLIETDFPSTDTK